jgi:hypothetical protein
MAFIRINRKLFDHIFWKENRVFSRAEAWIDLIQLVSFTPNNEKMIEGVVITWGRGQYPISHAFLSKRWNWSTHKVRLFITALRTAQQVATTTAWKTTILTLCKYDVYNPISQAGVQAEGQAGVQAEGRKYKKDKEDKELNKEKEKEKEKEIFSSISNPESQEGKAYNEIDFSLFPKYEQDNSFLDEPEEPKQPEEF